MPSAPNSLFRLLPSLDEFLRTPAMMELAAKEGEAVVKDSARSVLARLRDEISAGNLTESGLSPEKIVQSVRDELTSAFTNSLRPVINATGVILHTNLGRAPLSTNAIAHIQNIGSGY